MYTETMRRDDCELRFRVQGLASHGYHHRKELVCRTKHRTIIIKLSVCMLNRCILALADCDGLLDWGLRQLSVNGVRRDSEGLERHLI